MTKKTLEEMIEEVLNDRSLTNRRQIVDGLLSLFTQLVRECVGEIEKEKLCGTKEGKLVARGMNIRRSDILEAFQKRGVKV